MNGILPLWKPKGLTSHDCVMKIRRLFRMKKVGHTGTLDPDVAGVLPICLGEATKIIPYLEGRKQYVAHVSLGKATETEDSSGKVIAEKNVEQSFSDEEIDHVLNEFLGNIVQIPPMYSAVKVKGKRLYEYARKNMTVERPERNVTIYDINRVFKKSLQHVPNEFCFKVTCSKGTYIRTLCVDIGKKLGFPAHMSFLERTESDSFTSDQTVTFSQIEQAISENRGAQLLHPIERGISHLDIIHVSKDVKQRVLNGQKLNSNQFNVNTDPFLIKYEDELLAIYRRDNDEHLIRPARVFNVYKSEGEQT